MSCSVYNCTNHDQKTRGLEPKINYYGFPRRDYYKQEKLIWMKFCKRGLLRDGRPWEPTKNSKICSAHFYQNKRSMHPYSPSYRPTIYKDDTEGKILEKLDLQQKRFERFLQRRYNKETAAKLANPQIDVKRISHSHQTVEELLQASNPGVFEIPSNTVRAHKWSLSKTRCMNSLIQTEGTGDSRGELLKFFYSHEGNDAICQVDHSEGAAQRTQECQTEVKRYGVYDEYEQQQFLNVKTLKNNSEKLQSLTGVKIGVFEKLLNLFPDQVTQGTGEPNLKSKELLLMFLMRLKLDLDPVVIPILLGNKELTTDSFASMVNQLHKLSTERIKWPDQKSSRGLVPAALKPHFRRCRVILDSFAVDLEDVKDVEQQPNFYCKKLQKYIVKYLIGVSANGAIIFVSRGYGGRTSDVEMIENSGILTLLEMGDIVVAGKGLPGIQYKDNEFVVIGGTKDTQVATPPPKVPGVNCNAEVSRTANANSRSTTVKVANVKESNTGAKVTATTSSSQTTLKETAATLIRLREKVVVNDSSINCATTKRPIATMSKQPSLQSTPKPAKLMKLQENVVVNGRNSTTNGPTRCPPTDTVSAKQPSQPVTPKSAPPSGVGLRPGLQAKTVPAGVIKEVRSRFENVVAEIRKFKFFSLTNKYPIDLLYEIDRLMRITAMIVNYNLDNSAT